MRDCGFKTRGHDIKWAKQDDEKQYPIDSKQQHTHVDVAVHIEPRCYCAAEQAFHPTHHLCSNNSSEARSKKQEGSLLESMQLEGNIELLNAMLHS